MSLASGTGPGVQPVLKIHVLNGQQREAGRNEERRKGEGEGGRREPSSDTWLTGTGIDSK